MPPLTNLPLLQFRLFHLKDIFSFTAVTEVACLNLQQKLLHKRASVNCFGVGVSVPCFLLHSQS